MLTLSEVLRVSAVNKYLTQELSVVIWSYTKTSRASSRSCNMETRYTVTWIA